MKCENEIDGNCTETLDKCNGCLTSPASDGYGADILIIPADPRYPIEKRPLITNEMKAECIGEFSINQERICSCENDTDDGEPDPDCDACHGQGEYTAKIDIPWDTMKEIYKMMATVAARGLRVAP